MGSLMLWPVLDSLMNVVNACGDKPAAEIE